MKPSLFATFDAQAAVLDLTIDPGSEAYSDLLFTIVNDLQDRLGYPCDIAFWLCSEGIFWVSPEGISTVVSIEVPTELYD